MKIYLWALNYKALVCKSAFIPVPRCFSHCNIVWISRMQCFPSFFSSEVPSSSLWFQVNFSDICSMFLKNALGIFGVDFTGPFWCLKWGNLLFDFFFWLYIFDILIAILKLELISLKLTKTVLRKKFYFIWKYICQTHFYINWIFSHGKYQEAS